MSTNDALSCLRRGDAAGADAALARVLDANPRDYDALCMRAVARQQMDDLPGALAALDAALAIDEYQPTTHFNRANLLQMMGRLEEAVAAYARSLDIVPRDPEAWINRAAAERALGRDEDAARSCLEALRWDPVNQQALNDGAAALGRLERFAEALPLLDSLIAITPHSASAHTNRGKVLAGLERYAGAVDAYREALKHKPDHGPAWNNLGVAYAALGRHREAIDAYGRAAQLPSQHLGADHPLFNKAAALLLLNEYAEGFSLYAQRFDAGVTARPAAMGAAPGWDGARVDGVLRVMGEQGVGDQLLFARLLPFVLERTPRVVVDCDPRIAPLIKRAHPELEAVLAPNEAHFGAAAEIAMGDIAGTLELGAGDISRLPAVMRADAAKTAELRSKYATLAQGRPVVGIAWAAPRAKLARAKGAAIAHWGALLRAPYFFVSLQYGDARSDIETARAAFGCGLHADESVEQMRSLEDFAAQLSAMDHIVTVSNTTAHLAGSLGLDCTVLAPPGRGLHWYWGAEGEATPWYRSIHIARRGIGASWEDQIAAAARRLP
jgi:tetratricopeptide (TPR) repeat protein